MNFNLLTRLTPESSCECGTQAVKVSETLGESASCYYFFFGAKSREFGELLSRKRCKFWLQSKQCQSSSDFENVS